MDLGWPVWAGLVGAIVAVALAAFYWRFRSKGRPRSRDRASLLNQPRVEVLESTAIDAERRLVLVRCDKIEHLIMVGGPADLVVENDVRKVRGPATQPKQAPNDLPARPTNGRGAAPASRIPSPPIEAARQDRPAPNAVEAAQNRTNITPTPAPAPRPAARNVPMAATPMLGREDTARGPGRRDAGGVTPRRPQSQPAPAAAGLSGERPRATPPAANDRQPKPIASREPPRPVALPPAEAPWPDGDSIENDIVAAFRDGRPQSAHPIAQRTLAPAPAVVRDTRAADATLGDLAERLEEALAQEVQAANEDRRHELDLDAFGFDRTREAASPAPAAVPTPVPMPAPEPKKAVEQRKPEPKKPIEPKERVALKERVEAARAAASPSDAEVKREPAPLPPPERREEAPVISLNARRREAMDPLEDEMARLLGELTGDTNTKGR